MVLWIHALPSGEVLPEHQVEHGSIESVVEPIDHTDLPPSTTESEVMSMPETEQGEPSPDESSPDQMMTHDSEYMVSPDPQASGIPSQGNMTECSTFSDPTMPPVYGACPGHVMHYTCVLMDEQRPHCLYGSMDGVTLCLVAPEHADALCPFAIKNRAGETLRDVVQPVDPMIQIC